MRQAVEEVIKMMGLTLDEAHSLLHMTGGDRPKLEPGWRNRAVLSPNDETMASLIKKRLVKDNGKFSLDEVNRSNFFYATPKGLRIAKVLYWATFGKQNFETTKDDLEKANQRLYDNGLDPVVHI